MTTENSKLLATPRELEIDREALKGMDETVAWHTVGIVCESPLRVGTGTAVRFGDRHFLLTAGHVLEGCDLDDLRFFFRSPGSLVRGHPEEALPRLQELGLRVRQRLATTAVFIRRRPDIGLLEVPVETAEQHRVRFFDLSDTATTPPKGTQILSSGYPFDLALPVSRTHKILLPAANLGPLDQNVSRKGLRGFRPVSSFLVGFRLHEIAATTARGFSGAGGWFHRPTPGVWHSNLGLAGMVTHSYIERKILVYWRVEHIVRWLKKACLRKSASA